MPGTRVWFAEDVRAGAPGGTAPRRRPAPAATRRVGL